MKRLFDKYGTYIVVVCALLIISGFFKVKISAKEKEDLKVPETLKGKTIVTVWMREGYDSETRKYQIERFNRENDNIYIDFKTYKEDYFNLLRININSKNKPDIFQYGYYELVKYDELLPLASLGIDEKLYNKEDLLNFKGEPIGVKVTGNNVKLAWNKDMFKKAGLDPNSPPKTWNEVLQYSKKIKEACPDVVPFEFPAYSWGELKSSVGEVSANAGTIYTTFWDYKKGAYDFSYAKDILSVYNKMYSEKLTAADFDVKNRIDLRRDFYDKKAAMIISTYEDKNYFQNIIPLSFDIGITDIPKMHENDKGNYYYTENYTAFVVNKNIEEKDAVRKVYNYLIGSEVSGELSKTGKALPMSVKNVSIKNEYDKYDKSLNFKSETYDPTMYINYNPDESVSLFKDAIKGKISIDEAINIMNSKYAGYCNFMKEKDGFDFKLYIDNK